MIDVAASDVRRGFSSPAFGAQSVFRSVLTAMSRPGTMQRISCDADVPSGIDRAAYAVLLALADQDVVIALPREMEVGPVASSLRFHTGARIQADLSIADFCLVPAHQVTEALRTCKQGSDRYPETAATLVVSVPSLHGRPVATMTGPGIAHTAPLTVAGLDAGFTDAWRANNERFPCGIDVVFVCGSELMGLPRSSRVSV